MAKKVKEVVDTIEEVVLVEETVATEEGATGHHSRDFTDKK